ncbi:hypothetical protein HU200_000435 [Digitaria exilis]|uniref:Uncharacterized protein n=1 Tax=Digitaria exilis TaxID=1010633 RepID=A0A835FYW9_9POAL|nr:hypothetical protein HU200_000435 [Digitaria exilis]
MIGLLCLKDFTEDGRPEEMEINSFLKLRTATLNIASALGFGALAWSTVVHLSGFVGELRDVEFWIVTALSFVMACKRSIPAIESSSNGLATVHVLQQPINLTLRVFLHDILKFLEDKVAR